MFWDYASSLPVRTRSGPWCRRRRVGRSVAITGWVRKRENSATPSGGNRTRGIPEPTSLGTRPPIAKGVGPYQVAEAEASHVSNGDDDPVVRTIQNPAKSRLRGEMRLPVPRTQPAMAYPERPDEGHGRHPL